MRYICVCNEEDEEHVDGKVPNKRNQDVVLEEVLFVISIDLCISDLIISDLKSFVFT
jgi:hypothetical protein